MHNEKELVKVLKIEKINVLNSGLRLIIADGGVIAKSDDKNLKEGDLALFFKEFAYLPEMEVLERLREEYYYEYGEYTGFLIQSRKYEDDIYTNSEVFSLKELNIEDEECIEEGLDLTKDFHTGDLRYYDVENK